MPDNILRIGAEFDVGPIVAGSAEAAASIDKLGTSVGQASAAMLDELYPAEQQAAVGSDTLAASIAGLSASVDKLSVAKKAATQSVGGMTSAMGKARAEAGALDGSIGMVTGGLARLAAQSSITSTVIQNLFVPLIAGFAVKEIVEFVGSIADAEIKLNDLAEASGIPIVNLGELGEAAKASGAKSEEMDSSIKRLSKTISDAASGNKSAIETLHELGIEVGSWNGIIPQTNTILSQMADYLHQNSGNAEIMRAAMRALGTESIELTNLLSRGSQGLSQYQQGFADLATAERDHVEDAKQIEALEAEIGQGWEKLKLQILGATAAIIKYGIDENPVLVGADLLIKGLTEDWGLYVAAIEKATPFLDKFRDYEKLPGPPPGTGLSAPKPPAFATENTKDKKDKVDLERDELRLINDKVAAEKAAFSGDQERIEGFKLEIGVLGQKQKIEEDIARAEGRSTAVVDKEYYYKRIELTEELANEEQKYTERVSANLQKLASEQQRAVQQDEALAAREKALFSKEDKDPYGIEALGKKTQAEIKYQDDVAKRAEEGGVKEVEREEASVSLTARVETEKLAAKNVNEFKRIELVEQINAKELEELKKLEDEKLKIQIAGIRRQKDILLGGAAEPYFVKFASPEELDKLDNFNKQIANAKAANVEQIGQLGEKEVQNATKAATETTNAWLKAFSPIDRAFDTTIKGILLGTETAGRAFAKMGQNIEISVISALGKVLLKHVETEAAIVLNHLASTTAQTTSTVAGQTAQVAAVESGAAAKNNIGLIADLKSITSAAATAAANAYKGVLETIPAPLGIPIAAAAAAVAFTSVIAFKSLAASAEQGAVIPQDMPVNLHGGEMVLPRPISQGLQSVIPAMQKFGDVSNSTNVPSASSGGSSKLRDLHVHIAGGSNMTHDDIIRAVKVGIRRGQLA